MLENELVRKVTQIERELDNLVKPEFSSDLISPFLALPGLRGFWPMSAFDSAGNAQDQSGHGHVLTYNGTPTYNFSRVVPCLDLDGVGDYLQRTDEADLDILGTETYVAAAARGLTMGGWFQQDVLAIEIAMAKWAFTAPLGGQQSYMIVPQVNGTVRFHISNTGADNFFVTSTNTHAAATWSYWVGRFDPGAELAIFVDGVKTTNVAGIPASIFNSTAPFEIGCYDNGDAGAGGLLFTGNVSLCFLCVEALSDTIILSLFAQTRAAFGV